MNGEETSQNEREINRIKLLQYESLRENFYKNLVRPILGKGYYNMGMDVYSADQFTIEDLKNKFEDLQFDGFVYKLLLVLAIISNIILLGDLY